MLLLACVGGVSVAWGVPLTPGGGQRPPEAAPSARGMLGVVIPGEAVDLAAPFEGRVEGLAARVGARVREGDVLVTLEAKAVQLERARVEAELRAARAAQQVEELAPAASEPRLAAARLELARGRVKELEARLAQLHHQLEQAALRAPFTGVVGACPVSPGVPVRAGQPLVHLVRREAPRVRFAIPAAQVERVSVGGRVAVALEGGAVLGGQVTQVAPELDVAARMFFALATLEAEPGRVPVGTVVHVDAVAEQRAEN